MFYTLNEIEQEKWLIDLDPKKIEVTLELL